MSRLFALTVSRLISSIAPFWMARAFFAEAAVLLGSLAQDCSFSQFMFFRRRFVRRVGRSVIRYRRPAYYRRYYRRY